MAGSYCKFCGHRCFVYRTAPNTHATHWATCPEGMAFDRAQTGYDATTAHNPFKPYDGDDYTIASDTGVVIAQVRHTDVGN